MHIEDISKIYFDNKEIGYLFDIPYDAEENSYISYLLIKNRNEGLKLEQVNEYNSLLEKLKNSTTSQLKKKEYIEFLSNLKNYIQQYAYEKVIGTESDLKLTEEEIKNIDKYFKDDLGKKNR